MNEFFIIKCKDFTAKCNTLDVRFFKYDDNDLCSLETETVTPFELDLLTTDYTIDSITIIDYKFSIESYESGEMKIICKDLSKEEFNDFFIEYEEIECNFNLQTKNVYMTFTEFKNKFNLKGTKKQFIENTPEGLELRFYTTSNNRYKYTLYKTVDDKCMNIDYQCNL